LRLAALHFTPALGAVQENRAALLELSEAAAREADVLVLPELATTGFSLDAERAAEWAEDTHGPTAKALATLARSAECVIAAGLCLRDADGTLRNAQLVFDASGELVSVYAKLHLWGNDATWALPGERRGVVASTRCGGIGQLICADLGHPETVHEVARARPRLLAFSTNWVGDEEPLPLSWQIALRLLDTAPLVVANRGGSEGDVLFDDPSAILSYRHGGTLGARTSTPYVVTWNLADD
jgi:predicted amidohydrolase